MFRNTNNLIVIHALATTAVLGIATSHARADWTATTELTEVMMEAIGQEGMNLSEWIGYNQHSTVNFLTNVDVAHRTFQYQASQSYLGHSLTITGNGWYDDASSTYRWNTNVAHAFDSYQVIGMLQFDDTISFGGSGNSANSSTTIGGVEGTLGPITWSWAPNGDPISHANFTWKKKNGELGGIAPVKDTYKGNGEMQWGFVNGVPSMAGVSYNGWSDATVGGSGWIAMDIGSAVPAPGPLALLLSAALIGKRPRRR